MSTDTAAKFHAGTSGWSYSDWVGPLYPQRTPAGGYLEEYTKHFSVVEVDSAFYAVPARHVVEGWAKRTPESFRFALKVPSLVTHGAQGERTAVDKVLRDEENTLGSFLEAIEPLREKIICLVFQFPYFRVKEMAQADFVSRLRPVLDRLPEGLRAAVEVRNKSWITPDYLELLRSRRYACVLIDHPYMPPPARQLAMGMVTCDFVYIRLLGDRHAIEEKTQKWGAIVEDKSERLRTWADVIHEIAARREVSAVYAFSNNHFAGHAPETTRQLVGLVRAAGAPPADAFPF